MRRCPLGPLVGRVWGRSLLKLMNATTMSSAGIPHSAGPKLFISYRRADSADIAGRIYDRLAAYFGRDALFKDVDNIPIGANFEQVIASVVAQSAVVLVLVGPAWATIANERGRRLDDPQDTVRLEVEASLRRGAPTIPVLVEGASMPDPTTLPASLRPLFARGAIQIRNNPWFDSDMSQLATTVSQWLPLRALAAPVSPTMPATPTQMTVPGQRQSPGRVSQAKRRRSWLTSPVGLVAVVVLVMAVTLLGLAGAGLLGTGPLGRLGASATPLATAPQQGRPTATPSQHVVLDTALTHTLPGWERDSDCAFRSDGYHVTAPAGLTAYCLSPSSYDNFHLKVRVHATPGDSYGDFAVFFRVSSSNSFDMVTFSFKLLPRIAPTATTASGGATPTPDMSTWALWDVSSHSNGGDTILGSDISPAVNVTGDGDNLVEVYADGPVFTVLVNGASLGSFQDANNTTGQIGLGVEATATAPREAIYTNITVATLAR